MWVLQKETKTQEFNKKLSLASSNSVLVESEKYKVKQTYHMISALAHGNVRDVMAGRSRVQ